MSLLYIIDGYNAIKRSPLFKDKPLRVARTSFFSYLELNRPHGSQRNRLIVVFDGRPEVFGFKENHSFEVVFTSGESADEKIKLLVASQAQPKQIVVVTDDKELACGVRRSGAKIMGTQEFLAKKKSSAPKEKRPSGKVADETKAELNIVQREKITEELRRIWLRPK
jgi:predicted RNA-binding protein with PIN domain